MPKSFIFMGIALSCALSPAFAVGADAPLDLRAEIQRLWNTPTVITPTPGTTRRGGYELLTLPENEMISKLEIGETGKLENAFFKVVEAESDDALPLTDFDGRNVLYHLMEARTYFRGLADKTGVQSPALDHKITVRVRMTHEPNASGVGSHFTQVAHADDSGYMPFLDGKEEIWFFVRKRKLRNFDLYNFLTSEALAGLSRAYVDAGLTAAAELYRDYDAGIDTAKIPNVIWHEAFHWAVDDSKLIPIFWQGVPPAEDYANYFGSSLYGKPYLADLDEFTGRFYRRDYKKVRELKDFRASQYNSKALVPSLLWELRRKLGAERMDRLVWSSLPLLRASVSEVDVQKALIGAITKSALLSLDEKAESIALLEKNERGFAILDKIFGNTPLPDEPATQVSDPTELVSTSLSEEEVAAASIDQIELLHDVPDELKSQGIEMSDEEKALLRQKIDELKLQVKEPTFGSKVLAFLKKIFKPFKKVSTVVGQGIGIASETLSAAVASPLVFGTDFFTGLILGKGRITDAKPDIRPTTTENIIGAGGGVLTFYYANQGISLAGGRYGGLISEGVMGAVLVDQVVCSRSQAQIVFPEDRAHPTELQAYCARISKITNAIRTAAAKAGAKSGKALRPRKKATQALQAGP